MSEYEFTKDEEVVFSSISRNMLFASIILILSGLIAVTVGIFLSSPFDLISGVTVLAIGISLYFPTDNFKRIVSTSGEDIKELLTAFTELDKGWLIVNIISLVYMIVKITRIFLEF